MKIDRITYYLQCMYCRKPHIDKEEKVEGITTCYSNNVTITNSSFIIENTNESLYTNESFCTNDSLQEEKFEETIITNPVIVNQVKA